MKQHHPNYSRVTKWGMIIIGLIYFSLMIFPNLTGVQDWNMLSIFEKDEFAQHEHVIRMLTPGNTFYDTVRHFVVYLHYFYGYPFYFLSALILLPYRLLAGAHWAENTAVVMLLLRQLVSVLPMVMAIALMVRMQTEHRRPLKALSLFAFLLAIPAVVLNNFWWHPDSLAILLVALIFYFIGRDDFKFGKFFFLTAAACGVAVSVKYVGVFFVLAIPAYIFWGIMIKKINWQRGVFLAVSFVGVMALGLVVSNPLLLVPSERQEIIATMQLQFVQTRSGYYSANPEWNLSAEKLDRIVWPFYGQGWALIVMTAGLIKGIISKKHRLLNGMILAFLLPYFLTLGTSSIRPLYFLPMMIPLASALGHLFPESILRPLMNRGQSLQRRATALLPFGLLALLLVQFGLYLQQDYVVYTDVLYREARSVSIAFYHEVESRLAELDLADEDLVVYRDPTAYVPPKTNYDVLMKWKLASYDYLNSTQPDVLFLEMDYVLEFTKPDAVENAVDAGDMQAWQDFYGDAYADELPGYAIIYQNEYGLALIRSALLEQ